MMAIFLELSSANLNGVIWWSEITTASEVYRKTPGFVVSNLIYVCADGSAQLGASVLGHLQAQ